MGDHTSPCSKDTICERSDPISVHKLIEIARLEFLILGVGDHTIPSGTNVTSKRSDPISARKLSEIMKVEFPVLGVMWGTTPALVARISFLSVLTQSRHTN